jgi:hypothetical protein
VLQLHDFNPGITPNGVFWIVSLPDDAVEIHGNSLTIRFKDVPTVDQLQFPGGTGTAPVAVTFEATSFTASGSFSSAGQFGEMGTERNGSFVKEEGQDDDAAEVDLSPSDQDQLSGTALNQAIPNQGTAPRNPPRLKGKFPLRWPAHSAKEWATRDPRDPLGMCQGKRGR